MQRLHYWLRLGSFFSLGAILASSVLVSIAYISFSLYFQNRIFPGVQIQSIDAGELTQDQLKNKLSRLGEPTITIFLEPTALATTGATITEMPILIDTDLMAKRAFSVGRQSSNPYYNFLQILSARNGQINLPLELHFDQSILDARLDKLAPAVEKPTVNAVFTFVPQVGPDGKGRVQAFLPSQNGIAIDRDKISAEILSQVKDNLISPNNSNFSNFSNFSNTLKIPLYTKTLYPELNTSTADDMGLKTQIGRGESYFYDSIPGRVYNIKLGTEKVSGRLIAPNEIFSFSDSIGTVSAVFGFQKAYAIIRGKTVLDDGGGVCQVSTTIYRAALNAGLPIVERVAHAYRVGFYEQGGFKPGLDATVYPPHPDFRFKNDTGNWILLQAIFDEVNHKLSFDIFGTDDGRKTQIEGPFILSQTPPPEPIYEDDPTLPLGQVKQVDTSHFGAKTSFTRTVTRNGETLIKETVISNYIPWPARYLRGTKT